MKRKTYLFMRSIVENVWVNFSVGVLFLLAGLTEAVREYSEISELQVGAHHGAVVFAVLSLLKTLPDFFEGIEFITRSEEQAMLENERAAESAA